MDEITEETPKPVWCIAANVVHERSCGPGGEEKRSGTKHFAPGAKVHIVDFFWGTGGERVTVVGRHRKSHRYLTIVINSAWLVNWRPEVVYSPRIIKEVVSHAAYDPGPTWFESTGLGQLWAFWRTNNADDWASSDRARAVVEDIIEEMQRWHESTRTIQPFTTRPTQSENN